MAEGDSILRIARRIDASLAGSEVTARAPGRRRPEGQSVSDLDGRVLTRADSRGKHLLLHFDGGLVLHSHLGMKGAWHLYRPGERWRKPAGAAWIAIAGPTAEAVNFNGTSMRIVRDVELGRDRRLARLGPDLLGPGMTADAAASSLRRAGPHVELGDALLDQELLAGIGNIFKSEACWAAKADPWKLLRDVDDEQLAAVAGAAREQMLEAASTGHRPQRVYRRARRPCPRCRSPIRSHAQGDSARTTYWCPGCQR
jgi:endonuclease-8